jgi:hypothetical protein
MPQLRCWYPTTVIPGVPEKIIPKGAVEGLGNHSTWRIDTRHRLFDREIIWIK